MCCNDDDDVADDVCDCCGNVVAGRVFNPLPIRFKDDGGTHETTTTACCPPDVGEDIDDVDNVCACCCDDCNLFALLKFIIVDEGCLCWEWCELWWLDELYECPWIITDEPCIGADEFNPTYLISGVAIAEAVEDEADAFGGVEDTAAVIWDWVHSCTCIRCIVNCWWCCCCCECFWWADKLWIIELLQLLEALTLELVEIDESGDINILLDLF